jgi:hypothetical protein
MREMADMNGVRDETYTICCLEDKRAAIGGRVRRRLETLISGGR